VTADTASDTDDWLTPAAIAELMGVTPDRVRALILAGKLRGVRHGLAPSSPHRVRKAWLAEYLLPGGLSAGKLPAYRTPDMLTVKEAAALVGSPADTLWRALIDGRLEGVLVGSRRYIRRAALDEYAQARTTRSDRFAVATRSRNQAEIEDLHAEGFLTVPEAAAELGLTRAAAQQRINKGTLRAERRGRRYVVRPEWIADYQRR
jgi:excisionase family DNA binding protein